MNDANPPSTRSTGWGIALGIVVFIVLTLMALASTYATSQLSSIPIVATGLAVFTLILWVSWLWVLVLLVRALREEN